MQPRYPSVGDYYTAVKNEWARANMNEFIECVKKSNLQKNWEYNNFFIFPDIHAYAKYKKCTEGILHFHRAIKPSFLNSRTSWHDVPSDVAK